MKRRRKAQLKAQKRIAAALERSNAIRELELQVRGQELQIEARRLAILEEQRKELQSRTEAFEGLPKLLAPLLQALISGDRDRVAELAVEAASGLNGGGGPVAEIGGVRVEG